jgi:hypothetical protein
MNKDREVIVLPLNNGYLDFGLNAHCKLKKLGITNYIFLAMDHIVFRALRTHGIPVYLHPAFEYSDIAEEYHPEEAVEWGDPKFNHMVCGKVSPVFELLEKNVTVLLADVDIAWLADPTPYLRKDVDIVFTLGSCHLKVPDNEGIGLSYEPDGLVRVNTGFYYARPQPYTLALFKELRNRCKNQFASDDQTLMNDILEETRPEDLGVEKAKGFGFFDGCSFANGCVYFKNRCDNSTKQVIVHPNFVIGKSNKLKKMKATGNRHQLWEAECVEETLA